MSWYEILKVAVDATIGALIYRFGYNSGKKDAKERIIWTEVTRTEMDEFKNDE